MWTGRGEVTLQNLWSDLMLLQFSLPIPQGAPLWQSDTLSSLKVWRPRKANERAMLMCLMTFNALYPDFKSAAVHIRWHKMKRSKSRWGQLEKELNYKCATWQHLKGTLGESLLLFASCFLYSLTISCLINQVPERSEKDWWQVHRVLSDNSRLLDLSN